MNRILKALAVAALITVAGNVVAQVVQQDGSYTDPGRRGTGAAILTGGIYRTDTTMRVNTTDGSGNLYVREAFPPTTANFSQTIISEQSLAAAAACSSNVVNVAGLRHMKLLLKPVPGGTGAQGTIVRLAVQVRTHLNGSADSASTFAEYPLSAILTLNSATAMDTLTFGHLSVGSATLPWSGEFVVQSNNNRNAPGNGVAAIVFSYPNGIAIPLDNVYGRDFWGDNISVRVRNIGAVAIVVTMHLIGTPL